MEKRKFNVLDFVILTVIILCIAALAVRYIGAHRTSEKEMGKYAVTVSIKNVRSTTADAFVVGDSVFLVSNDAKIGTLESLDSNRPASTYANDLSGGIVKLYYPENTRVDLTATVSCLGVMNEKGFFADGTQFLSAGMNITLYTGHMYADVTVIGVTEVPD